jgi:hypothetical protein
MGTAGLSLRPPRLLRHLLETSMPEAMRKSGLTKTEADDLLDWLEANGCRHFELVATSEAGFAVRWWD